MYTLCLSLSLSQASLLMVEVRSINAWLWIDRSIDRSMRSHRHHTRNYGTVRTRRTAAAAAAAENGNGEGDDVIIYAATLVSDQEFSFFLLAALFSSSNKQDHHGASTQ
jgi:hypothetical protein